MTGNVDKRRGKKEWLRAVIGLMLLVSLSLLLARLSTWRTILAEIMAACAVFDLVQASRFRRAGDRSREKMELVNAAILMVFALLWFLTGRAAN
jgi:dipeptide/tripeptide permease